MARPCKTRLVGEPPAQVVFKPAGVPARDLEWVELAVDEYEALRLVDGEGLEQEAAAELMGVSRPTVSRILGRGRGKLAHMLAIANGNVPNTMAAVVKALSVLDAVEAEIGALAPY